MASTLAPAVEDFLALKPTMTMSIWCTCYSITIIIFRVIGRWLRTKIVFIEDVILALSIVILVARVILISRVLYQGTNNVDLSFLSEEDVRSRETGSQLVLVTRILYALYLWVVKLSVGVYLTRLIDQFWAAKSLLSNSSGGRIIKNFLSKYTNCMFYSSLGLSFIGVFITEMVECRPFSHYWQVVPDPGPSCRQSYGQLFTMGAFNALTDIILIALPLPMIIDAKLTRKTKFQSLVLVLFPLVNISFTVYRVTNTVSPEHRGSQRYRTLMASLDILLSTTSANILVVTSFLQGRGFKKTNYNHPRLFDGQGEDGPASERYVEEGSELNVLGPAVGLRLSNRTNMGDRRSQVLRKQWGSDEDLMRDDAQVPLPEPSPHLLVLQRTAATAASDADGFPADDCSMKSTSRLSPWAKTQTNISVDKVVLPTRAHSRAGGGGGGAPADEVAVPQQTRRASTVRGIVVETTWHVDVTSSPR